VLCVYYYLESVSRTVAATDTRRVLSAVNGITYTLSIDFESAVCVSSFVHCINIVIMPNASQLLNHLIPLGDGHGLGTSMGWVG